MKLLALLALLLLGGGELASTRALTVGCTPIAEYHPAQKTRCVIFTRKEILSHDHNSTE